MKFQVISLFPELFESFASSGLFGKGLRDKKFELLVKHLREHAINKQGQVDDTPFGGGSGMLLRPEPAAAAIEEAKALDPAAKVVIFTPRGKSFSQKIARELVKKARETDSGFILLCPRYEGADERISSSMVDYEISLGDYITMGGELAAMVFMETTSRLLPEVLGNPLSHTEESFEADLLEHPQYTKPRSFGGLEVPEVLVSGHHENIRRWQKERALEDTIKRRPDLINSSGARSSCSVNLALIHHPVLNKEGKTVTTSLTNLDIHDIARTSATYELDRYYIAHPVKTLRKLAKKICEHWSEGYGSSYNPSRSQALQKIALKSDLDDILLDIETRCGEFPRIIATSAKKSADAIAFETLKAQLKTSSKPHLILFGTGWGLTAEVLERAEATLEPIAGSGSYNHLSVRAAAAIICDRLLG